MSILLLLVPLAAPPETRLEALERKERESGHYSYFTFARRTLAQRLGVAQALINEPALLVLDEPNEGLDLSGRQLVAGIIREQRAKGGTVLLVSHVLPEVEQLCDRVAVIIGGHLAYEGPVNYLTCRDGAEPRTLEQALAELYGKPAA